MTDSTTIQQVMVEKVHVTCQEVLSEELFIANHVDLQAACDHVAHVMVLRLQSSVLGKQHGKIDVERQWPADWWQAVRERWFPRWWLKRWPVRYCQVSVHEVVWNVCPHLNIKTMDGQRHLEFLIMPPKNGDR